MKIARYSLFSLAFILTVKAFAQADNEIQVYASPTIGLKKNHF